MHHWVRTMSKPRLEKGKLLYKCEMGHSVLLKPLSTLPGLRTRDARKEMEKEKRRIQVVL